MASEAVHTLDILQAENGTAADRLPGRTVTDARRILCPVDETHGGLGVHSSGAGLVCTKVIGRDKNNAPVYCQGFAPAPHVEKRDLRFS